MRERAADYFEMRGDGIGPADHGRFNVTREEEDRHRFKVPTLRNIALTWPYFHDGSTDDLAEAVRVMGRCQCEDGLAEDEVDSIAIGPDPVDRNGSVLRRQDLVAEFTEHLRGDLTDGGLVVDDQDAAAGRHRRHIEYRARHPDDILWLSQS